MKYNINVVKSLFLNRFLKYDNDKVTYDLIKIELNKMDNELRGYNLSLKQSDRTYLLNLLLRKYKLDFCPICTQTLTASTIEVHNNFVKACADIDHSKVIAFIQSKYLVQNPFDFYKGVYTYKLSNAIQKYRDSLLPIPQKPKVKPKSSLQIAVLKEKERLEMIKLANKRKLIELKRINFDRYLKGLKQLKAERD